MEGFKMIVDGFVFKDEKTAQKACQESDGVQYVRERLDMENPQMVLEMYRKLMSEKVFETPVGIGYLKELRDYLIMRPEMKDETIEPIEIEECIQNFGSEEKERETGQYKEAAPETEQPDTLEWYIQKLEESKQQERVLNYRRRRAEEKMEQCRKHLRLSLLCSLFLLIVAAGMVVITMTDNHPNIINYENKLIEKYEAWETELKEREESLKEREAQSKVTP